MSQFSPGIIIPTYNHGGPLKDVIRELSSLNIPLIIVDDGNCEKQKTLIKQAASLSPNAIIITRTRNGGKGSAMSDGVRYAQILSLTHVLQVDADGQHDLSQVKVFLDAAQKNPDKLINSYPSYDDSAPAIRKNSRWFATKWVHWVTLDSESKDVLCGFRVYPMETYIQLLDQHACIDSRMGYDADILIHYLWKGIQQVQLPVSVTYPKDGVSNFHLVRDNMRISLVFARATFGMLFRLPVLIARSVKRKHAKAAA